MKRFPIELGWLARLALVATLFTATSLYAEDPTFTDPASWLIWLMSRISVPGG